jgi:hypothetical protein
VDLIHLAALGQRATVELNDEDLGRDLRGVLDGLLAGDAETGELTYTVERDDQWVVTRENGWRWRSPSRARLLGWLVADVTRQLVDRTAHVVLHAGGAVRHGRAALVPGLPDAGKSTLVAALVTSGWDYLSDEAVGLDARTGRALPCARPILLDTDAVGLFPEWADRGALLAEARPPVWALPACSLGGRVAAPAPVDVIAFARYEPDAPVTIEPVRRSEALAELSRHTFGFHERSREALYLLADLVQGARCVRLTSGDLAGTVAAMTDLVDQVSRLTRSSIPE